jgi:hypothetical protein
VSDEVSENLPQTLQDEPRRNLPRSFIFLLGVKSGALLLTYALIPAISMSDFSASME